jgi:rhodanese-related sulfurtransferase
MTTEGQDMTSGPPETKAEDALRLARSGALLLDVREPDEWDRGHSPLATPLPMSELQARVEEIPSDAPVLVVCHSGVRSARVAAALVAAGYEASSVSGGMIAWAAAGGELVAADGAPPEVD